MALILPILLSQEMRESVENLTAEITQFQALLPSQVSKFKRHREALPMTMLHV